MNNKFLIKNVKEYLYTFSKPIALYILFRSFMKRKPTLEIRSSIAFGSFFLSFKLIKNFLLYIKNNVDDPDIDILYNNSNNNDVDNRLVYFMSCFISSQLLLNIDTSFCESKIMICLVLRAIKTIVNLDGSYLSTLFMCFSSNQIIASLFSDDYKYIDKSYLMFLEKFKGSCFSKDFVNNLRNNKIKTNDICKTMHPNTINCLLHSCQHIYEGLNKALQFYIVIYIPFYLMKMYKTFTERNSDTHKIELFEKYKTITKSYAKNIIVSSSFLASYCTFGMLCLCFISKFRRNKIVTKSIIMPVTYLVGLTGLIERKTRRTELALYCLTYALDAYYNKYISSNKLDSFSVKSLITSVSISVLLYHHEFLPNFVRKNLCLI